MWRVPLLSKDVRAGLSALLRGGIWVSSSAGFCRGPGRLHLCVCRACCHQPHFGGQREENDSPESPAGRGRTPGTKMKEGRAHPDWGCTQRRPPNSTRCAWGWRGPPSAAPTCSRRTAEHIRPGEAQVAQMLLVCLPRITLDFYSHTTATHLPLLPQKSVQH